MEEEEEKKVEEEEVMVEEEVEEAEWKKKNHFWSMGYTKTISRCETRIPHVNVKA